MGKKAEQKTKTKPADLSGGVDREDGRRKEQTDVPRREASENLQDKLAKQRADWEGMTP